MKLKIGRVLKTKIKNTLLSLIWHFHNLRSSDRSLDVGLTIGITTFADRYELYFKPLIDRLITISNEQCILVAINGHIDKSKQKQYLISIQEYLSQRKISYFFLEEPKGLSYLWNRIINESNSDRILLLNDDLIIKPSFKEVILKLQNQNHPLCTINSSFSHFLISKSVVNKVGWFDERLVEIGGEDDDYKVRCFMEGVEITNLDSKALANTSHRLKLNSYGYNMLESDSYSIKNTNFLFQNKWQVSDEWFEDAIYIPTHRIKYWRLRKEYTTHKFFYRN